MEVQEELVFFRRRLEVAVETVDDHDLGAVSYSGAHDVGKATRCKLGRVKLLKRDTSLRQVVREAHPQPCRPADVRWRTFVEEVDGCSFPTSRGGHRVLRAD